MVLCDDKRLDERLKELRNLCFGQQRFVHEKIGFNYRMTNMQAALGVAQLERIEEIVKKKRWIGETYNHLLRDLDTINLPIASTPYCDNIYWVYAITIKDNHDKTGQMIINELASYGIGARPFFFPMHRQPVFKKAGLFADEMLPVSEKLYEKGFYIPSGLALTDGQASEVSDVLHKVLS